MTDRRALPANDYIALTGHGTGQRETDGTLKRIVTPIADLHASPDTERLERQLLLGEPFLELAKQDGMSFGRAELSGYVGYLHTKALGDWQSPTHKIIAASSLAFTKPNIKSPNPTGLSFGARVTITGEENSFLKTDTDLFVPNAHLSPIGTHATDPVTEAEKLLNTPYLWGGNSSDGIDCSGLVQIALRACGQFAPGDSDQQRDQLGTVLPENTIPQRGDLFFWKGHVAWVVNAETLLHANAHHMATAYEPLHDTLSRILATENSPLLAHKRL